MGAASRYGNREGASLPQFADYRNGSRVQLHELLHQREADARSFDGSSLRALDAVKALEDVRQLRGRYPRSRILNRKLETVPDAFEGNAYSTFESELEGVGQKIENDLFPHLAVDRDRPGTRLAFDREFQPRSLHYRAEIGSKFRCISGQIERFENGLHSSGFNAREVEQAVHQFLKAKPIAVNQLEQRAFIRGAAFAGVAQQFFHRTEHQGQRSAQLVAYVRKKGRLGAIDG